MAYKKVKQAYPQICIANSDFLHFVEENFDMEWNDIIWIQQAEEWFYDGHQLRFDYIEDLIVDLEDPDVEDKNLLRFWINAWFEAYEIDKKQSLLIYFDD